LCLGSTNEVEQ